MKKSCSKTLDPKPYPLFRAKRETRFSDECRRFLFPKFGFTLIELLVTISIIGILFGLGMAKYQEFNRRQILVQAAREVKSNLRLAQGKALAGEKSSGWCAGEALKGYRLYFSSDTNYKIEAVCTTGPPSEVKSVNLPSNVTGPDGESVLFKVLAQGVEEPTLFMLCAYRAGRLVSVEEAGNIYIEESDCVACPGGWCIWQPYCWWLEKKRGWSGCNDSYTCPGWWWWWFSSCCCQY